MKTRSLFFAGLLALWGGVAAAEAQPQHPDSLLLDERQVGDYRVRRYRVEHPDEADYTLRYRINLTTLNPRLGDNAAELQAMESFFRSLTGDTLRSVKLVSITGYASPDGPQPLNERLSKGRTADFKAYGDKHYHFSTHYSLENHSVAEDWEGLRRAVMQSPVPDREAVLKILDGPLSHHEKELQLKALPAAWEYLKEQLLPPLRRVEVVVNYARSSIVEHRTLVQKPRPAPREIAKADPCDPCACPVVDEEITGIIIEYPEELQTTHHNRHAHSRRHRR